jgi:hypothetical protein
MKDQMTLDILSMEGQEVFQESVPMKQGEMTLLLPRLKRTTTFSVSNQVQKLKLFRDLEALNREARRAPYDFYTASIYQDHTS